MTAATSTDRPPSPEPPSQNGAAPPTTDPRVALAFAVGWQVAELYQPRRYRAAFPKLPADLPGIGSLSSEEVTELRFDQIDAAVIRFGDEVTAAGLDLPTTKEARKHRGSAEQTRRAVLALHTDLLRALTATDFRLGKAYGLGRALHDTCTIEDADDLRRELKAQRVGYLQSWLLDLKTPLPDHAGEAVYQALKDWQDWARAPKVGGRDLEWAADGPKVKQKLRRQGEIWRALLSGEKLATETLSIDDYVAAGRRLLDHTLELVRKLPRGIKALFWALLLLAGLASAVAIVFDNGASAVAALGAFAASIGISWSGLKQAFGRLATGLKQPLWGAELDAAIASAASVVHELEPDREPPLPSPQPTTPAPKPAPPSPPDTRDGLGPLGQIKHIVVVMMENRSFDHMLGYLQQNGMPEVRGLDGNETNPDDRDEEQAVFAFAPDQTAFHLSGQPFGKELDPCHSPDCVREQLELGNRGFLKNFIAQKNPPPEYRHLVMGHYTAEHLPVYDHLARNYCICDSWHSSIPGDTWPNRLYSLTGGSANPVGLRLGLFERLVARIKGKKFVEQLKGAPIYDLKAFTHHLRDQQWRWYSHDPATLRAADETYRKLLDRHKNNFAFFDRKRIRLLTEVAEFLTAGDSFLDDAAKGQLRDVSWIDPNFIDFRLWDPNSSDDHPPSDIRAGQALVLDLYDALANSPDWADTLLVIVYDEHGGFYDHVAPPSINDGSGFSTYGVRVPALIVGPRVKRFVCHQLFDHTSLIKSILLRFAERPAEAIRAMGPRVEKAADLGLVLESEPRTDLADHGDMHKRMALWREQARAERRAARGVSPAPDGAGQPMVLQDFQEEFAKFALAMREKGLPPGHP